MSEHKTLTVFTPTFNRRLLLRNCYDSLRRQTSRDFVWLIVDDGSQDGTGADVAAWKEEAAPLFDIQYIKKENGGLHTAYNAAIAAAETELFLCVDDDDYLTDTAVEEILREWQSRGHDGVAGLAALNRTPTDEILGKPLPDLPEAHIIDLRCRYGCTRDLKMIYRTEELRRDGPIPVFPGEKDLNPYWLFLKVDRRKPMLLFGRAVCVVNYQPDGMSRSIFRQYAESPNGFAELRIMMMAADAPFSFICRNAVHYVSSAIFARKRNFWSAAPRKLPVLLALLPGAGLNLLIRARNLRSRKKARRAKNPTA